MRVVTRQQPLCRVVREKDFRPEGGEGFFLDIDCGNMGGVGAYLLPGECYIARYNARPTRVGYGSAALPLVEGWLRDHGCSKSVLTPTQGSEAFWRKMGYECQDKKLDDLTLRCVSMKKVLT